MKAVMAPWRWWNWLYNEHAREVVAGISLLVLLTAVGTYANGRALAQSNEERLNDNETNSVVSCQNANESREASRTLWNFVLDLSIAGNTDATPQEIAYLGQVRIWVNKVYQSHDCQDLSRKYPLPPPPTIPAG